MAPCALGSKVQRIAARGYKDETRRTTRLDTGGTRLVLQDQVLSSPPLTLHLQKSFVLSSTHHRDYHFSVSPMTMTTVLGKRNRDSTTDSGKLEERLQFFILFWGGLGRTVIADDALDRVGSTTSSPRASRLKRRTRRSSPAVNDENDDPLGHDDDDDDGNPVESSTDVVGDRIALSPTKTNARPPRRYTTGRKETRSLNS